MDNDIFIPYKFRASQIVGLAKVAVKFIEANGIRFREELNTIPTEKKLNKLTWYNYTQAKIRSELIGSTTIGEAKHWFEMWVNGNWGPAGIVLQSADTEPENPNPISVTAIATDRATKEGNAALVMDHEKRSSFVQLHQRANSNSLDAAQVELMAGLVQNTGAIIFGTGFTVEHTGVGTYSIRFKKAFPAGYAVTGNDAQNTRRLFTYSTISNLQINVTMCNPASFAPEDIAFSFLVVSSV